MTIKIYHQAGHNTVWNIDSFEKEGVADGIIFSPVHQSIDKVKEIKLETRKKSIFDPQFYVPNSTKNRLQTYPFFPEVISNGFETIDFGKHSQDCARSCLEFQIESNFEKIIIPARFFDQLSTDYTSKQESYTVEPFLNALNKISTDKDVFLTFPVTSHMIMDESYRTDLLNWVSSFPEIDGIYLLVSDDRKSKQIKDEKFLFNYLKFCHEIKEAELEIIVGCSNTEGLLFSMLQDISITIGAYENTRIFSIDKFLTSNDGGRGPAPRIYLPGLFNWVRFSLAERIKAELPEVWGKVHIPTEHSEKVFNSKSEPHFTQSDLYKHYFIVYSEQMKSVDSLSPIDCHKLLRRNIKAAGDYYSEIDDALIDLDAHGNGDHINPWLNSINRYIKSI